MSLLMDALKKAEREKKEAAKRLKEAQEKSSPDLALEESSPGKGVSEDLDVTVKAEEEDISMDETLERPTGELSLTPIPEGTPPEEPSEPVDLSEETGQEEDKEQTIAADQPLSLEGDETRVLRESGPEAEDADEDNDEPGSEERSMALNALSVDEEYTSPLDDSGTHEIPEETIESTVLSRSYDDTKTSQAALSAYELAKSMGDDPNAPRPAAAQTVFDAGSHRSGRQFVEWFLFIIVFAVLVIGGSTFYYLKTSPEVSPTSMPVLAETEPVAPVGTPLETESTVSGTFVAGVAEEEEPVQLTSEEEMAVTMSEPPLSDDISPVPAATEKPPQEPAPEEPAFLPENIKVERAALEISRSRSVSQKDVLLHSAYGDYKTGNYHAARAGYQEVLAKMPENRDALLGMAAVAHKQGDVLSAHRYYLRVLELYPSDVIAKSAIIGLAGDKSSAESETLLKLMIRDYPETASLYFTLGNIYAASSRWPEAQQTFFDAYRLDNSNADYAYNLAVSLDHLGKTQSALQFYEQAMELSEISPASLNRSSLASRISVLSDLIQGQ